jgi:hypothetical protein
LLKYLRALTQSTAAASSFVSIGMSPLRSNQVIECDLFPRRGQRLPA